MHLCTLCILVLLLYLVIDIYVNQSSVNHCTQAGGNGFSNCSQGFESSIQVINQVIMIKSFPYVFSLMTQIGATLHL
jgi:hypothetical protein